jgi:hypothetical protein
MASGFQSSAFGTSVTASGDRALALGFENTATSYVETSLGMSGTSYTPISTTAWNGADRLFNIGNGTGGIGFHSDAFTILKDGRVGIGISNFENPLNQIDNGAALLQVNGAIYATGLITQGLSISSDERLKKILLMIPMDLKLYENYDRLPMI